jgi:hypothetical protein
MMMSAKNRDRIAKEITRRSDVNVYTCITKGRNSRKTNGAIVLSFTLTVCMKLLSKRHIGTSCKL